MTSAAWLAIAVTCCSALLEPGDHVRTCLVQGVSRSYLVHVPPQYRPEQPLPLVLVFHGGGGNAEQIRNYCGMDQKADSAGFITVYPAGSGRFQKLLTFNGGNCCGYAMQQQIDDVAFVRQILDELPAAVKFDPRRVFATGMSNGGILCYRLASELSDRIAAIAPVAGTMGTATCHPKQAVSILHFHGSADANVRMQGGVGVGPSGTNFYSVDHSIQAWVKANGCQTTPTIQKFPDRVGDGTTITRHTYSGGRDGAEVALVVIEGGAHTWPGREPRLQSLGKSTRNLSANDEMWEFFQKHPQPEQSPRFRKK